MMSLQYPLLFPYGETGYSPRLQYSGHAVSKVRRECTTMREFYAYQIQTRPTEGMGSIKSGRLLHQYIVDAYIATEQERLRFISLNQKNSKLICIVMYVMPLKAETLMHHSLAERSFYLRHLRVVLVTANPNWVELSQHLDAYGGESANSRPDLECRLFKLKLDEMVSDFKKGVFFPKTSAVVYTIEFQKRGLPHVHILLWLEGMKKEVTPSMIDEYISAELPDKDVDPDGFALVERHMIHSPCGKKRPKSPCMNKGECTKAYPKPLADRTHVEKSGFIIYRRRSGSKSLILKGETELGNQNVVPHNLRILKKYQAHINVEWCCRTSAIKYLFKYITKGVDRATILIEEKSQQGSGKEKKKTGSDMINEIDRYMECRYISACEAAWRLFAFHIHHNQPNVIKFHVHLPGQHRTDLISLLT
ncbi:hypothetical protein N665_0776s0020 [Sinapis alba]|nr:hypothetical protein N665_0776s0020 [Sinapis alba]